ncbi:GNAT family N-acetyltransferase [Streptomyces sp. 891-h]|uniref:GNAT family N-acetyltransferase n=1 Tax=Streptomyces sp. 891-h TaxID=2720714 RepID=UPI001FAAFF8E|nr:GNAT family N-acetyltransferase [Streptomyces sp. 891-h]UNZ20151.1 GNAT family N-acetyltransferase [Streptomyces sp. 891-h]
MTFTVRSLRPDDPRDAESCAAVRRAAIPYLVCTAETLAWQLAHGAAGQRLHRFVAERPDGTVAGCIEAGLVAGSTEPGQGFVHTAVEPGATGRGAGSALVAAGETYLAGLGVRRVFSWVADEEHAARFAEHRGYARSRQARFLGLELRRAALPELPDPLPAGVTLHRVAEFADDLRPLYEADTECSADEPGDVPVGRTPFPEWLRHNWQRPDWNAELSSVVLVDGQVAAYSVAQTDGVDRYWSGMTGTRRAFRGRGLARLAKLAALRRARAAGYAHAYTGNDAGNAPMLAVNRRLGYTEVATEWRCAKRLCEPTEKAGPGRD